MENFTKGFISILIIVILGSIIWIMLCDKGEQRMKNVYKKNVKTLQKFWADYENEDLDAMENSMVENIERFFYNVNHVKGIKYSKYESLESAKRFFDLVENISLNHHIMLPGIDSVNLALDGTVRMYSGWSFDINDETISFSVYGFYDFIEDKISLSLEWYDQSGIGLEIRNAINQNERKEKITTE